MTTWNLLSNLQNIFRIAHPIFINDVYKFVINVKLN